MITPTINVGPVFCAGRAGSIRAALTAVPSMRGTILGWLKPIIIGVINPTTIQDSGDHDGEARQVIREVKTSGHIQPGNAEVLAPAQEGERSWENATLWVLPQLDVPTGTVLVIDATRFEVMGRKDWKANGYMRYDLIQTAKL